MHVCPGLNGVWILVLGGSSNTLWSPRFTRFTLLTSTFLSKKHHSAYVSTMVSTMWALCGEFAGGESLKFLLESLVSVGFLTILVNQSNSNYTYSFFVPIFIEYFVKGKQIWATLAKSKTMHTNLLFDTILTLVICLIYYIFWISVWASRG